MSDSKNLELFKALFRTEPDSRSKQSEKQIPVIPGYEIEGVLGRGGMGTVYKARQLKLDRVVAIKVLDPDIAEDDEYVARFVKEARISGRLRHQNLVSALDCGISDGHHYMVMEFVQGQSLDQVLKERGPLHERVAIEIVRQVAEGLDHAWRHRVVHRDIKPRNLILTPEGITKICDLGIARAVHRDPSLTATGHIVCTPAYASPEQARGRKDVDCRSDIYSLGISFYELVTGDLPFRCDSSADYFLKHASEPRVSPSARNPGVSSPVSALILEMIDPDVEKRPKSPKELSDRIRKILEMPAPEKETPPPKATHRDVVKLAGINLPGELGLSVKVEDDIGIVALRGKLLETLDADLNSEFERLVEMKVFRVVVDCSRLEYLSSRGVSVLISAMDACREAGGDLHLAASPRQPRFVLERLGVTLILRHFETVEAAIDAHRTAPVEPIESPELEAPANPPGQKAHLVTSVAAPPPAVIGNTARRVPLVMVLAILTAFLFLTTLTLLVFLLRAHGFELR